MKIVGATLEDGKMCAHLLNFLKVCKAPEMSIEDHRALSSTLGWLNDFAKGLAHDLQAQNAAKKAEPAAPVAAAPILPVPKKKSKAKK